MKRKPRSIESFDCDTIEFFLDKALNKLCQRDKILFKNDSSERSICHRLAMYLQALFPDFDVDCEYNCDQNDPKLIKRLYSPRLLELIRDNKPEYKGDSVTVFPDIIVHRRNTPENLLVIETKKTTSRVSDDYDKEKLFAYKRELHYRFAKFLRFGTMRNQKLIFQNHFLELRDEQKS